ncbi:hypothetical protein GCM10027563_34850 [Parasphingorhabdus pacifica]
MLLALGVVAMHHAPFSHGSSAGAAQPVVPPAVDSSHHLAFDDAARSLAVAEGFEAVFSAPLTAAETKSRTGHGELLHLCLAILAGAAVFLVSLVLLATIPPPSSSARSSGNQVLPRIRPPPPVLRRLAVLCVLRL